MLREGVNSSGLAAEWGKLSEEERKARLGGELGGFGGRGRQVLSQDKELDQMARQSASTGGGKPHNLFDQMFAQQRQFQAQDKAKAVAEEAKRKDELSRQEVERFNAYIGAPNQTRMPEANGTIPQGRQDVDLIRYLMEEGGMSPLTAPGFPSWMRDLTTGPGQNLYPFAPGGGFDSGSNELISILGGNPPAGNFNGSEGNVVRSGGNLDDGMPPSSATPEEKQRWFGEGGKFWDTKIGNAIEKYGDEGKAIAKVLLGLAFPPAAIPLYISAVKGYARDQAPGTRYSEAQPWMKEKFPGAYAGMYEKDLIPGLAGVQSPYGLFDIASGLAMGRPQDALGWTSWLWGNRRYFDNYGLGRGQGGTS
jgi:hypothetical protein